MTLHSPTENSLAVLNHKILDANSQVQNVKLGGHQTCCDVLLSKRVSLFQDNTRLSFGTRAAGVHYRLFSLWTLVPVRLDKHLSGNSTVGEIASEAAYCHLTYTMANCPQRR
ncbi:hypothetical protein TNCV_2311691 [Trichonephila clavipes]|nr:hypothetical protein TNCV_2311691 [Trichonephila clavipes]